MVRVTIDRFEGDFAVCEQEDRSVITISKCAIPSDAKEGDILVIEDQDISIDVQGTDRRKTKINKLVDDLWQ